MKGFGAIGVCVLLSWCNGALGQALATVTPCPACPASLRIPPVIVTSQFQAVPTCSPTSTCQTTSNKATCSVTVNCQTVQYVSTTIGSGSGAPVITAANQIVTVRSISTVLTSISPCPTATITNPTYSFSNGTAVATIPGTTCTPKTALQTYVEVDTAPFSNIGAFIIPGFAGSGLCQVCGPDANGTQLQPVHVSACLNNVCTQYDATLISATPTSTSSSSTTPFSTQVSASSGVNTVTATVTITPSATTAFPQPVVTVVIFSTSLSAPQAITFSTNIAVTFSASSPGGIAPSPGSSSPQGFPSGFPFQLGNPGDNFGISNGPVTGNNYGISNGPVSGTNFGIESGGTSGANFGIKNGGTGGDNFGINSGGTGGNNFGINTGGNINGNNYGINNGGSISGDNDGINSGGSVGGNNNGITINNGGGSNGGGSNGGGNGGGSTSGGNGGGSVTSFTTITQSNTITTTGLSTTAVVSSTVTTTGGSTTTPTVAPVVAEAELEGCFRGTSNFTFNGDSSSMTNDLCISDCRASGYLYSGVAITDCYCGSSLEESGNLVRVPEEDCNTPCPGNPAEACGGFIYNTGTKKVKRRLTDGIPIIIAYSQTIAIPPSTTASTTTSTPDPSSDPDADTVQRRAEPTAAFTMNSRRGYEAAPSRQGLRIGGQIQGRKESRPAIVVKRDFGMRQLFGLD